MFLKALLAGAMVLFALFLYRAISAPYRHDVAAAKSRAPSAPLPVAHKRPATSWERVDVPQATGNRIDISFKMDSRLTRSLHVGDRWVSPPTFSQMGTERGSVTVEARANVLDSRGTRTGAIPEWISADPNLLRVQPVQANNVVLKISGLGETTLRVVSNGALKILTVRSLMRNGALQAEIVQ